MREPEPYDHGRNGRKRKRRRHVPLYRHRPLYRGQLGPLVGHKLRRQRLKGAAVIGTLDKPVHAMNLELYIRYIQAHYSRYVVVAIDASVGSPDHVAMLLWGGERCSRGLGYQRS